MTAGVFRKKPVEIEAMKWDGTADGCAPIIEWVLSGGGTVNYYCHHDMGCPGTAEGHTLSIQTLEGRMQASAGDWIIRGVKGEFYPCKPDIFAATYETVGSVDSSDQPDHDRGLYRKYRVERVNGQPVGEFFVLEQHDPLAIAALWTYALQAADTYPVLAADLCKMVDRWRGRAGLAVDE